MVKYLERSIKRLQGIKDGMTNNASHWSGVGETPEMVQMRIDALMVKSKQIDDSLNALKERRAEARILREAETLYGDKMENLALGVHSESPEKLTEYNITLKKQYKARQRPVSILIPVIADDTNGKGFIVSTQFDELANHYEWFKGVAADPKEMSTVPEMHLFLSTVKTSFVDRDVQKGVRYFYRVQAVNRKGAGPLSEDVSRVQ